MGYEILLFAKRIQKGMMLKENLPRTCYIYINERETLKNKIIQTKGASDYVVRNFSCQHSFNTGGYHILWAASISIWYGCV